MLTLNADKHPLMNRMHKPDPALGPDRQDKRSVIPIAMVDVDTWLAGTTEDAKRWGASELAHRGGGVVVSTASSSP